MNILTLPLGPLGTNCYLVSDGQSGLCAVIDPGASAQKILQRVQEAGWKIGLILLTHAHFDHTGALKALHSALPAVPIYVHPADSDNARNMSHGNLVYTDTYQEGDTVKLGALEFTVLETPGHTPGSVCLRCGSALFPATRCLQAPAAAPILRAAAPGRCLPRSGGSAASPKI